MLLIAGLREIMQGGDDLYYCSYYMHKLLLLSPVFKKARDPRGVILLTTALPSSPFLDGCVVVLIFKWVLFLCCSFGGT